MKRRFSHLCDDNNGASPILPRRIIVDSESNSDSESDQEVIITSQANKKTKDVERRCYETVDF